MAMRRVLGVLWWAAAVFGTGLAPVSVAADSLTDALIMAYETNPSLVINRAALQSLDETMAQAQAARRPTLSLSATQSYTQTYGPSSATNALAVTLSSTLTLYDGGNNRLAQEQARTDVLSYRQTLVGVEQAVLLAAVTAFMDMRRDLEALSLAENAVRVLRQEVRAAKDRFELGEVTKTDVSQAEASKAAASSALALAQGTVEISREAYFIAVGAYPGRLKSPPPTPGIPTRMAEAKSIAGQNHPDVIAAQLAVQSAQMGVDRAVAAMGPSLSLTGSLNSSTSVLSTNGANDTATVSITGSQTIYSGGSLSSLKRQSELLLAQRRAELQQTALFVSQNVALAWAQLSISRATITARQTQVRAARIAFRGVKEEAKLGARTTLDALDAEQDLFRAQSDLIASRRDEYVAVFSLLSAMGLLTVEHLKLGVATYDPSLYHDAVKSAPTTTDRGKLLDRALKRAGRK